MANKLTLRRTEMISFLRKYKRSLALTMVGFLSTILLIFGNSVFQPTMAAGNGINVIIMIGDGMGWNLARAAAVAKGAPFTPVVKAQV